MNNISLGLKIYTRLEWELVKDYIKPFLHWRFLISFGIAWMITNGWSYIFVTMGSVLHIKWMFNIGISYQAFLWLPCTPEKLVTIPIAIFLHRLLFPKDFGSIEKLNNMLKKSKKALKKG